MAQAKSLSLSMRAQHCLWAMGAFAAFSMAQQSLLPQPAAQESYRLEFSEDGGWHVEAASLQESSSRGAFFPAASIVPVAPPLLAAADNTAELVMIPKPAPGLVVAVGVLAIMAARRRVLERARAH